MMSTDIQQQRQQGVTAANNEARLRLHLLSIGYIRYYLTTRNINLSDISQIIVKLLFENWKFDYYYDHRNRGSKTHWIENNGKTLKCIHKTYCKCFYSTISSPPCVDKFQANRPPIKPTI